jgi:predicted enzyme related to lactoylglutathione lyase
MTNPILVWSEVPVTDMDRAVGFYNRVFGWKMTVDTSSGPNPMAVFGGDMEAIGGHLYPGKPANGNGPTVHLAVPDKLEDAADRCWAAGGAIKGEPVEIPYGRFLYASDPDGNSIGLFEPKEQ